MELSYTRVRLTEEHFTEPIYSLLLQQNNIDTLSSRGGGGGEVLNKNLGRGVWPTQETLTLFKTQKILLPCLRERAVISYPVQDWTKQAIFTQAFSCISRKAHESAKGENKRRFAGTTLFRHENVKGVLFSLIVLLTWKDKRHVGGHIFLFSSHNLNRSMYMYILSLKYQMQMIKALSG